MSQNRLNNEQNLNNFRNFYEWLRLENQQLGEIVQTPRGQRLYQEIRQAECATMLEMMLPAHRRTTVVPQNKTGVAMCSCTEARRCSEVGEPVVFICKEHQAIFGIFGCYWEDEVSFFLERYDPYDPGDSGPIPPEPPPLKGKWSDRDFLKNLGISPD